MDKRWQVPVPRRTAKAGTAWPVVACQSKNGVLRCKDRDYIYNKEMTKKQKIQLFEEKKVRTVWDDDKEKWFFCVVDVVEAWDHRDGSFDQLSYKPYVLRAS